MEVPEFQIIKRVDLYNCFQVVGSSGPTCATSDTPPALITTLSAISASLYNSWTLPATCWDFKTSSLQKAKKTSVYMVTNDTENFSHKYENYVHINMYVLTHRGAKKKKKTSVQPCSTIHKYTTTQKFNSLHFLQSHALKPTGAPYELSLHSFMNAHKVHKFTL